MLDVDSSYLLVYYLFTFSGMNKFGLKIDLGCLVKLFSYASLYHLGGLPMFDMIKEM